MTAAQGIMARASEAIGRAVAAAGSVVYAAAGSVLGSPPVPPVVLDSPRAVWVVAWMDSTMGDLHATVWDTPYAAGVERARLRDDTGSTCLVETFLCEVRT